MHAAYYNDSDAYCAAWLRNLMRANLIAPGEIDARPIQQVRDDDITGFTQCHWFAGIGAWSFAARLAGWPDDRELWTGSLPCQPFSKAGQQRGVDDVRHLWPQLFRRIRSRRPRVWMGEQVCSRVGVAWFDGVCDDLESIGYTARAVTAPACAVDAPHRRERLWIVADADGNGCTAIPDGADDAQRDVESCGAGVVADAAGVDVECGARLRARPDCTGDGRASGELAGRGDVSPWHAARWVVGYDGKARRIEPGVPLLVDGVPSRVRRLRAYGNALVPQVAAQVMRAYMDCKP